MISVGTRARLGFPLRAARVLMSFVFLASTAHGAAPSCGTIFRSSTARDSIQAIFQNSASWLGEKAVDNLTERAVHQLERGEITPAQIQNMGRIASGLASKHAFRWSQWLRMDVDTLRADLARGQVTEETIVRDLTRVLKEEDLVREDSGLTEFLQRRISNPNTRSLMWWTATHIAFNATQYLALGNVSLMPLYLPSLRFPLGKESIDRMAAEAARVGPEKAYQDLPPDIRSNVNKQITLELAQRTMNLIFIAWTIEWLLNLPNEINEVKVHAEQKRYESETDATQKMLMESNRGLIARYRKILEGSVEPERRALIEAEINRLLEQNQNLSASKAAKEILR